MCAEYRVGRPLFCQHNQPNTSSIRRQDEEQGHEHTRLDIKPIQKRTPTINQSRITAIPPADTEQSTRARSTIHLKLAATAFAVKTAAPGSAEGALNRCQ